MELIITLDEAKRYVRLDLDDTDEDEDIKDMILEGQTKLFKETGKIFTKDDVLAKRYVKLYVSDVYDNRGINEKKDLKVRSALESILTLLSYSGGDPN